MKIYVQVDEIATTKNKSYSWEQAKRDVSEGKLGVSLSRTLFGMWEEKNTIETKDIKQAILNCQLEGPNVTFPYIAFTEAAMENRYNRYAKSSTILGDDKPEELGWLILEVDVKWNLIDKIFDVEQVISVKLYSQIASLQEDISISFSDLSPTLQKIPEKKVLAYWHGDRKSLFRDSIKYSARNNSLEIIEYLLQKDEKIKESINTDCSYEVSSSELKVNISNVSSMLDVRQELEDSSLYNHTIEIPCCSALIYAVLTANAELAKILVENGADPALKNTKGFSAHDMADQINLNWNFLSGTQIDTPSLSA